MAAASLAFLSALFSTRRDLAARFEAWPERLGDSKAVFSAVCRNGAGTLLIFINLTGRRQITLGHFQGLEPAFTVNAACLRGNKLILGPYAGIWLIS